MAVALRARLFLALCGDEETAVTAALIFDPAQRSMNHHAHAIYRLRSRYIYTSELRTSPRWPRMPCRHFTTTTRRGFICLATWLSVVFAPAGSGAHRRAFCKSARIEDALVALCLSARVAWQGRHGGPVFAIADATRAAPATPGFGVAELEEKCFVMTILSKLAKVMGV